MKVERVKIENARGCNPVSILDVTPTRNLPLDLRLTLLLAKHEINVRRAWSKAFKLVSPKLKRLERQTRAGNKAVRAVAALADIACDERHHTTLLISFGPPTPKKVRVDGWANIDALASYDKEKLWEAYASALGIDHSTPSAVAESEEAEDEEETSILVTANHYDKTVSYTWPSAEDIATSEWIIRASDKLTKKEKAILNLFSIS